MTGLVRFAGLPATVAPAVIEELKALGEDFRQALFKPGDSVRLADGPLAGLEGIFERADGDARAIVLLEFLSREHRMAVPMECVQAAS
jgi:transcriptional antiterminator RfaH